MTPDEAIKDLENSLAVLWENYPQHRKDAVRLGLEALKFRLRWEQQEGEDDFPLLPGETKD